MTQTYPPILHPERRALLVSLGLHALLFLLIVLFADLKLTNTLSVTILSESPQRIQELPEEEEREIIRPSRSKGKSAKQQKQASGAAGSKRKGKNNSESLPAMSDPWSQYEQQMHSRKSAGTSPGSASHTEGTKWGSEKTGKNEKRGESEKVNIPKGDSSTATRWRKGAARRLLSMPPIEYPESVRKKSGQGKVELLLEVDAQGRVESVEILKSSGSTRLDISARNAYRNAVFSPSPSGETATGVIVVTFKMRE